MFCRRVEFVEESTVLRPFVSSLCALIPLMGGSIDAALLAVDLGVADGAPVSNSANQVQSGFSDFSVDPTFDGNAVYDFVNIGLTPETRTFSGVDVTLSGTANGPTLYDFTTDVSDPQGDLLEDVAQVVQGNLTVQLSGLNAGTYLMTTYHHFGDNTASANPFSITVDTGAGAATVATDVPTSFGFDPSTISTETFQFTANGTDPVLLTLVGGGGAGDQAISPVLNGFEVSTVNAVPESGSLTLCATVLFAVGVSRIRRRRNPAAV
jgi:hypothetical protein